MFLAAALLGVGRFFAAPAFGVPGLVALPLAPAFVAPTFIPPAFAMPALVGPAFLMPRFAAPASAEPVFVGEAELFGAVGFAPAGAPVSKPRS